MDKVLVTLLLLIAGVVCSVVVINAAYPAITGTTGAISDAASKIDDRIRSQIRIIDLAKDGDKVYVWIKNVGTSNIKPIQSSDIFWGPEGNFSRIIYGGPTKPYWDYVIENDTKWGPTATVKATIYLPSAPSGTYYFKIAIPNGISDWKLFSTS
jgi:archaeal flagellar protein FlaG